MRAFFFDVQMGADLLSQTHQLARGRQEGGGVKGKKGKTQRFAKGGGEIYQDVRAERI